MAIDITKDLGVEPGDLKKVTQAGRQLYRLMLERDRLKVDYEAAKKEYLEYSRVTLPALLKAEGYEQGVPLADGYRLELEQVFTASVPAESTIEKEADDDAREALQNRRDLGLLWLDQNNGTDIIKEALKIELPAGQKSFATAIRAAVEKVATMRKWAKQECSIVSKQSIHQSTLGKFLREKIGAGVNVPFDVFEIYDGKQAVIKKPAQGKKGNQKNGKS